LRTFRNSRIPYVTALAIILLWSSPLQAGTEDRLWQRAVAIAAANENRLPATAEVRTEIRDRSGSVVETRASRVAISRAADGRIVTRLIERNVDGRRSSPSELAERNRRDTRDRDRLGFRFGESPFLPDLQSRIRKERLRTETLRGRPSVVYRFTLEREGTRVNGSAWLDAANGAPLRIRFAPDPTPRFIRELGATIDYASDPERWVPLSMTIEGEGGFLLYERHFRTVYTFGR
jgi:hypothetical protein